MNNRPLILRTVITLVVVGVFVSAMHPLFPKDYYETFLGMLKDKNDAVAVKLVKDAGEIIKANPQLYQSQALLKAADDQGIVLAERIKTREPISDNRDVLSLIRKHASSSIRLGLDLNGGVEFMLQLVPDEALLAELKKDAGTGAEDMKRRMDSEFNRYRDVAIEILRKRLENQKIFEAEIAPSGSDYVVLRAPVVTKDEKLKLMNLIKMSAKLSFRLVHEQNTELVDAYLKDPEHFKAPIGYELMSVSNFRAGDKPQV
ncbi:MAG: hypothetical protein PHI35_08075, partial [Victivallaceae bacterium]|nr:hypothetical protein [Victivallaceae bacterium]